MKKLLAPLILVLLMLSGGCAALTAPMSPPPDAAPASDPIETALSATVVLFNQEHELFCAATRVSPTRLVTAFHCVAHILEPGQDFESDDLTLKDRYTGESIYFATYAEVMATEVGAAVPGTLSLVGDVDILHDLAMLETEPSGQTYVRVNDDELRVGQPVFSLGHPAGLDFTFARGYVSNTCRHGDTFPNMCWTQLDISVYGGSSGGGIFNEAGELIGVTSRRVLTVYSFVAPPYAIESLVR